MGSMAATQEEFTVDDLAWLPKIAGASHDLVDGLYVITAPDRPFTYDDLVDLPDVVGAGRELLDGAIVMSPSPNLRHQGFVMRLAALLHDFPSKGTATV